MVNNAFVDFLVLGCISDHSCYIVALNYTIGERNKSFKCLNIWTLHGRFEMVVTEKWDTDKIGTAQFVLKHKFSSVKRPLLGINYRHFSHISTKANKAKEELEAVQRCDLSGDNSDMDIRRTEKLMEAER